MAKQKQTNGKDPAVLLYTQDFIVGTLTMTHQQRGKYILLLCYQHQKENKLTLNDLKLLEGDEELLSRFPLHSDGYYYNDRLAMEIANRKIFTDSRRENGGKGGRPKKDVQPLTSEVNNLNKTIEKPYGLPNGLPYGEPSKNHTGNENGNETGIVNGDEILIEIANKKTNNSFFNLNNKTITTVEDFDKVFDNE